MNRVTIIIIIMCVLWNYSNYCREIHVKQLGNDFVLWSFQKEAQQVFCNRFKQERWSSVRNSFPTRSARWRALREEFGCSQHIYGGLEIQQTRGCGWMAISRATNRPYVVLVGQSCLFCGGWRTNVTYKLHVLDPLGVHTQHANACAPRLVKAESAFVLFISMRWLR